MLQLMVVTGLGARAADYHHRERSPTACPDEMWEGYQSDDSGVDDLLIRLGHEKDYKCYVAVTIHQMGSPGMWSIVDQLAQTLLTSTSGVLTTSQIAHLSQATPKFAPRFWQLREATRAAQGQRE
jgi:hypothetical protein